MNNVLKISIFALIILCSTMVYSQTDDNANQIMQKINEAFSQGDCDRAQRNYNVWKDFTQTTDASVESRIAECVKEEKKRQEAGLLIEQINETLSQGDCDQAQKYYNAWKSSSNVTDAAVESRIAECEKAKKGSQKNTATTSDQIQQPADNQLYKQQPISNGTLTASVNELLFSSAGGVKLIEISTNAKDYRVLRPSWIFATKLPNGNLQIVCKKNTKNKSRKGSFTIYAEKKSITINVVQEGKEMPVSSPVKTDSATATTDSLPTPVKKQLKKESFSQTLKSKSDYKKNVFGLDLGIGARKAPLTSEIDEWGTFIDFGIHYTHNFSRYFGVDIFNLKFQGYTQGGGFGEHGLFQAMTGIRAYTKNFAKDIKGTAALKVGYGYQPHLSLSDSGVAWDFEIGLNFTKKLFAGFVFNCQALNNNYLLDGSIQSGLSYYYYGGRISYNF